MTGRTKIVATLGPASLEPPILDALLRSQVDVVRLNLSHGALSDHLANVTVVRAAARRTGNDVAILADLPGPKVRAGKFPPGGVELVTGSVVRLTVGERASTAELIEVDYASLCTDVAAGDRIVVGDGAIAMTVTEIGPTALTAIVTAGGRVQGSPGIHLPSERLALMTPTGEDLEYAVAMAGAGADFLALSFVRSGEDVRRLRDAIGDRGPAIVAKIETASAVDALPEILELADAVMVARGDLGIECPLEDVPHLQKRIIRACVESGTPVITATQMLESMITSPAPTRAEVSDVANAVFDGTDAVMLSAETAVGADPVNVVATMRRIAARAEADANYAQWGERLGRVQRRRWPSGAERITAAITHAALQAANDIDVAAILCCTRSGRTALSMARYRPLAPLIALSPDPATLRRLALSWGVTGLLCDQYASTDELVWFAVERSVAAGLIDHGDTVLVLAGAPERGSGASTDVLRVVAVG